MAGSTTLTDVKRFIDEIAIRLPSQIDVAALGVWSKAPYLALVTAGSLAWRTEELGRNAHRALSEGERATGILLCRAVVENAALVWHLRRTLEKREQYSRSELHEILTKMLLGWRSDPEFPPAFNVLNMIDRLDKEIPKLRRTYDALSEIAHPNYSGAHGLFAKIDRKAFVTNFGRDLRGESLEQMAVSALARSLGLFIYAYDAIVGEIEAWLPELTPLTAPRDPDPD